MKIATPEFLKRARKRTGWTHRRFAKTLGITNRLLESWMYERGIPSSHARMIYLAVLHVLQTRVNASITRLKLRAQNPTRRAYKPHRN